MVELSQPAEGEPSYAYLSDEELMARLLLRDTAALEAIYDRHARALFSLALRVLGDRQTAEEVVQECYLKLWRAPHLYQPQRGRPLTWLLGVTHHRAVDELRRRGSERRFIESGAKGEGQALSADDPEQRAWLDLETELLSRAMDSLPPPQRQVLLLAYYEGMTQTEIATHLGEPLGTVKTRVRLAMRKLRALTGVEHA